MHVLEPLSNVIGNTQCVLVTQSVPLSLSTLLGTYKVKTLLTFASGLPQVFETNLCSI